jgi:hypothetical protein
MYFLSQSSLSVMLLFCCFLNKAVTVVALQITLLLFFAALVAALVSAAALQSLLLH